MYIYNIACTPQCIQTGFQYGGVHCCNTDGCNNSNYLKLNHLMFLGILTMSSSLLFE